MSVMEKKGQGSKRPRRSFAPEFKRDAVSMVLDDDRTIADVVEASGIGPGNLRNWVRQARVDWGETAGMTTDGRPSWFGCVVRYPTQSGA